MKWLYLKKKKIQYFADKKKIQILTCEIALQKKFSRSIITDRATDLVIESHF